LTLNQGKKIYFISDFHLGVPGKEDSKTRERKLVKWFQAISKDAQEIHLVGDIFDYWFEYKSAVPKGYVRILGEIARLSDSGIKIYWYYGNHDMWIFDYIPDELGVEMVPNSLEKEYNGKKFFLAHGDGLGPGDRGYKFIKKVFRNRLCQWIFARFHPNFGMGLMRFFSTKSRYAEPEVEKEFKGDGKEWLQIYSEEKLKSTYFDFLVFGHRHLPLDIKVGDSSRYINLGDWLYHYTYAVFDGESMELKKWE
jgi:UDP-2,3-diacylglucosamine hydrolase